MVTIAIVVNCFLIYLLGLLPTAWCEDDACSYCVINNYYNKMREGFIVLSSVCAQA